MPIKQDSTLTHAEHSILDELKIPTADGDITQREIESMGVRQFGNEGWIQTAYTPKDDKHHDITTHIYKTESDARHGLQLHNDAVRSHVIVEDRPEASVDEMKRLHEQKIRHAKENAEGHSWGLD